MNPLRVVEPEEVLDRATGRKIIGWHLDDEGLYLSLDDGGSVVFYGSFAISVVGQEDALQ